MIQMDEMSRSWKFDDSSVEDVYVTTWGWTSVGKFAVINHSTKFHVVSVDMSLLSYAFIAKAPAIWGDFFSTSPHGELGHERYTYSVSATSKVVTRAAPKELRVRVVGSSF